MHQLSIYGDPSAEAETLRRQLGEVFKVCCRDLDDISAHPPDLYTIVDASLKDTSRLLALKAWLAKKSKDAKVVFVVDKSSRLNEMQAFALGATAVVHRPVNRRDLLDRLWGDFAALAQNRPEIPAATAPGVVAAFDALQNIFHAACTGGVPDPDTINAAGDQIVAQIGTQGLADWIDTVRRHHSQTYQHCLLVTGLAVGFGQHLGIGHKDRIRLSLAGLLHDVGKARIPVSILEKPGPLDQDELATMRDHTQLGFEALQTVPGVQTEMLDLVLHHHEYLDGSGYPEGLQGGEISDLVRIMTIADVFGALIERRSYKQPLTGEAAYQILLHMGPKLDQDLVRAFSPVAQFGRQEAA